LGSIALLVHIALVSSFQPKIPTRHLLIPSSVEKLPAETSVTSDTEPSKNIIDQSTFTLLEHVNLNVPNHDYILDFYLGILGCGLDPRVAVNVMDNEEIFVEEGLIWPNCGANQFHLPRAETAQVLPGHIGLRYRSLDGLKARLCATDAVKIKSNKCFESYEIVKGPAGDETIKIKDRYGNMFHCREGPEKMTQYRQPILSSSETEKFGEVAVKYGREESDCRGIDYIEFNCRIKTAEKIASFYDSVFDATTFVLEDKGQKVALIAFGDVDETGQASQYMIFRETPSGLPKYDGHHIAIYVGQTKTDFERAFRNAEMAGIVWVNPRFADKVTTLDGAKSVNQFRFRDILDIKTGELIFQLEHEIRSVEHPSWPGGE